MRGGTLPRLVVWVVVITLLVLAALVVVSIWGMNLG